VSMSEEQRDENQFPPRRVAIGKLWMQEFSIPFRFRLPGGSTTPVAASFLLAPSRIPGKSQGPARPSASRVSEPMPLPLSRTRT
jgi:hypothetical protein